MPSSKASYILLGRVHLITSTTVEGALYGFVSAIYIFCARLLYLQLEDRDRRRQHLFTLLYTSLVMALVLSGIIIDSLDMQASYVDHADYSGGGYGYSLDVFMRSPVAVVGYTTNALFSLMMSGVQIWRLWIIWRASRYSPLIVALPVLSLLTYLGFDIANIVILTRSGVSGRLNNMFFYGEIAPQLCISAIVTIPIIARIHMFRRRNMKIIGRTDNSSSYTSVISMLIESFALESVWMVVQLGVFAAASGNLVTSIVAVFFTATQPFIQLVAYFLVIHRVTTGRAWKEDTAEKLTTLQWNRDGLQTTQIGTRASIPILEEEA